MCARMRGTLDMPFEYCADIFFSAGLPCRLRQFPSSALSFFSPSPQAIGFFSRKRQLVPPPSIFSASKARMAALDANQEPHGSWPKYMEKVVGT